MTMGKALTRRYVRSQSRDIIACCTVHKVEWVLMVVLECYISTALGEIPPLVDEQFQAEEVLTDEEYYSSDEDVTDENERVG